MTYLYICCLTYLATEQVTIAQVMISVISILWIWMTSRGFNAALAAMIASTINPIPANATGIVINFSETYGYTNDGVLGWNLGPISARFTY